MTGKLVAYHQKSPRVPHFENHCARELFKGSNRLDSLLDALKKIFFGWGLRIFCD